MAPQTAKRGSSKRLTAPRGTVFPAKKKGPLADDEDADEKQVRLKSAATAKGETTDPKLLARRPTGKPTATPEPSESGESDADADADADARWSAASAAVPVPATRGARRVAAKQRHVRLPSLVMDRRGDCPHIEDEWCTCGRRVTGVFSTYVDFQQPPYTIWHAGTDEVQMPDSQHPVLVHSFNMRGEDGFVAQLCNYGARITSILQPDGRGYAEEILLSFPNMHHLQHHKTHYVGGLLGRVAGRVPRGKLRLAQLLRANLSLNANDDDHLNGGDAGAFDRVVWSWAVEERALVFTHASPAGSEGYPGSVLVTARYTLEPTNVLTLRVTASCSRLTALAPALRLPLNLAGHGTGKGGMLEHVVVVQADTYQEATERGLPKGSERRVACSPYDLRLPRELGDLHGKVPWPGYRVWYRLNQPPAGCPEGAADSSDPDKLPLAARLYHPITRRCVELRTDQPLLYLETASPTLPVDPEDKDREEEWQRQAWARLQQQLRAVPTKSLLKGRRSEEAPGEGGGEDVGEDDEETKKTKKAGRGSARLSAARGSSSLSPGIQFGADIVRTMVEEVGEEEAGEEEPPPSPVQGRGRFFYYRCGAITLQPMATTGGPDLASVLLKPTQRLLYTASLRFYLRPRAVRRRQQSLPRMDEAQQPRADVSLSTQTMGLDADEAGPPGSPGPSFGSLARDRDDLLPDSCSLESGERPVGELRSRDPPPPRVIAVPGVPGGVVPPPPPPPPPPPRPGPTDTPPWQILPDPAAR